MTAAIMVKPWVRFLREEYLETFIKQGGAAVKFAIPLEEDLRSRLADAIAADASASGYLVATVSSASTRIHMMDQLFFRIAEQIDWQYLTRLVLRKLQRDEFAEPAGEDASPLAERISQSNAISPQMVKMKADQWIDRQVFHQRTLARDFRVAMTQLCLAELYDRPEEARSTVITDWLTGRNRAISPLRPYLIYTRISRNNARYLFESLLHWVRFAGYSGLLIILDTARLGIAKNPHDESLYYTKAMLLDAYEVLRQFIDGTDRMTGCILIVAPAADFLDVGHEGRGMGAYNALRLRVYDEVRDKALVNPMGAMVRLSEEAVTNE